MSCGTDSLRRLLNVERLKLCAGRASLSAADGIDSAAAGGADGGDAAAAWRVPMRPLEVDQRHAGSRAARAAR